MPSNQHFSALGRDVLLNRDILASIGKFMYPASLASSARISKQFCSMVNKAPNQTWFCNDRATHALAVELIKNDLIKIEGSRIEYTNKLHKYCLSHPYFAKQIIENPVLSQFLHRDEKVSPSTFKGKLLELLLLFTAGYVIAPIVGVAFIVGVSIGSLVVLPQMCYEDLRDKRYPHITSVLGGFGLAIMGAIAVPVGVTILGLSIIFTGIINFSRDIGKRITNASKMKNKVKVKDIYNIFEAMVFFAERKSDRDHKSILATRQFPTIATIAATAKNIRMKPVSSLTQPAMTAVSSTSKSDVPAAPIASIVLPAITSATKSDVPMTPAVSALSVADISEEFATKIRPFFKDHAAILPRELKKDTPVDSKYERHTLIP